MDLHAGDSLAVALVVLENGVAYPRLSSSTPILMVVRDPRTNDTHPNVVSVPTARMPTALLHALWPRARARSRFGWTRLANWEPRESHRYRGNDPVIHVVRSIFAQKLGLADALESGTLTFEAGVVAATAGWSHYDAARVPSAERLTMVTVLVAVTSGAGEIPERTASYSKIRWVPLHQFMEAAAGKDPSRLGLDPIKLCIHGLCIASAYDVVASALGHAPYHRADASLIRDA
jgi:hypothetical protein